MNEPQMNRVRLLVIAVLLFTLSLLCVCTDSYKITKTAGWLGLACLGVFLLIRWWNRARLSFRRRQILKWVGGGVCLLIILMGVFNGFFVVTNAPKGIERNIFLLLYNSNVFLAWSSDKSDIDLGKYVSLRQAGDPPFVFKWPRYYRWDALGMTTRMVEVPLWSVLAFSLILTTVLWWLDRPRPMPGHCRHCGYNLTGNVSGICPECGMPIKCDGEH